jgi:endonuclease/exonuclease/phosphatase (EEP) superfamily protein YafD
MVPYAGTWHFYLDLMAHFRLAYLIGSVLAFGLCAGLRARHGLVLSGIALAVNAAAIVPWYWPTPRPDAHNLRILATNLLLENDRHADMVAYIANEDPDIIVVQEFSEIWARALDPIRETYPHTTEAARSDHAGIGIFSKLPLIDPRIDVMGPTNTPCAMAELFINGRRIRFLALHAFPPFNPIFANRRNVQFQDAAIYIQGATDLAIIAGDLNCTPWSSYYKRLERDSGLKNARRGFGLVPSWPTWSAYRIPIDHCLVSPGIGVKNFRLGPDLGSDHLPTVVDLHIPAS